MASNKRTIMLLGEPYYNEEGAASEEIKPGHLVDGVTAIAKHATAGGACPRAFAVEREELGRGIDDTYKNRAGSAAYAIGDQVKVAVCVPGQHVLAIIASGQNISANARLESAGNGTLRILNSGVIIARALEAVNNSAGPSDAYIRVEVMP